ncbi:helix-turn-helix transcriptional regulator [Xanthomonas sp. NCPPB 2654]|uniref:AraC family transcriptional regulator n=1 Tax=unclassified Xanthomonas TaxID=2643310 RepID=UPI0021E0BED5|nr:MULTISPECIES: helix-turn-helix transcriptional regulator [unclassified Xanthomonas]MDL5367312.1 helix-turn-helix transcriptional regulator [Xanthomonas sp. NCPPB 2654]UYC19251.1 helix-turn-helix transcriptional regulator [Xanthomonas sp. CFBP 8443]
MNIEIAPSSPSASGHEPAHLLDPRAKDWFERADGPSLLAFLAHKPVALEHEVDWHRHVRGQMICVEEGLLSTRTEHGHWSLPPGCAGWMPPQAMHTVQISGPLRGYVLLVAPSVCADLPDRPCVIGINGLLRELLLRVASWDLPEALDADQQRIGAVLLDELRKAPLQGLHLPMPSDRRLLRIAGQLLATPADDRSLAQWAHWAGLSPRSLSRHFRDETGLGFAGWRQQARLAEALRQLSDGASVADAAHRLGYSSPSAFVTAFRGHFGHPPARYLASTGRTGTTRGLASPAASG